MNLVPTFADYTGTYDLMIDLETLGTEAGCYVKTASLVPFTRTFGAFSDGWCLDIVFPHSGNGGIDADTVFWWFDQGVNKGEDGLAAMRAMLKEPTCETVGAGLQVAAPLLGAAETVWANGPTFDLVILEWLYRHNDLAVPWRFWNERCVRTATEGKPRPPRSGAHEASADCFHQIEWVLS